MRADNGRCSDCGFRAHSFDHLHHDLCDPAVCSCAAAAISPVGKAPMGSCTGGGCTGGACEGCDIVDLDGALKKVEVTLRERNSALFMVKLLTKMVRVGKMCWCTEGERPVSGLCQGQLQCVFTREAIEKAEAMVKKNPEARDAD